MKKLMLIMVALLVTVSAQALMVDDFTADTLDPAWVQTDLVVGRGAPISFSTTLVTGDVLDAFSPKDNSSSNQNLSLLLRNDETLDVGETLLTTPIRAKNNTYTGLMITGSTSPADRANSIWINQTPNTGDNGIGNITVVAVNGADLDANTSYAVADPGYNFDTYTVLKQYITRLTTTTYDIGYIDASGSHSITTATIDAGTAGAAIGYYFDMRAYQYGEYDDFEIIPEPATMALLGLGSLLAIRRKNRKA